MASYPDPRPGRWVRTLTTWGMSTAGQMCAPLVFEAGDVTYVEPAVYEYGRKEGYFEDLHPAVAA